MALAYLLDPNLQIQNQAGVNNVAGFIRVFMNGTDDRAVTYSDFTGTLNPADIPLDNNGRCVIIADSEGVYRVEVYNRNGGLCWTQYPLTTMAGGGGSAPVVALESSDGSIGITRTSSGGKVTYDLAVASGDPNYTEWAKCSGANTPSPGIMIPLKADGNMDVTADGITLKADNLYHITARFAATKTETSPYYDNITVSFNTYDGEHTSTEVSSGRIVDYSMGLEQEFEISADIKVGARDESLYFSYAGQDVAGGAIRFRTADIHMLNSGVPHIPGGMASREWVSENYQEKLTAGEGITIEDNVISADAAQQVQSNWTESDTSSPAYIQNKPSLATVATSGSYNDLTDKPDIPSQQVQSDWAEANTSSPAYIKNKPDMDSYATDQELTAGLATKQDVIQDIAAIRAGAQQGATAVQPSDLAAVATSGSYNDLSNKPTIPAAQVQSDWNESNSAAVDFIKNKPNLATVATSGDYNDLSNKPTIPAAQVNSDWNASSGVAQILNKPSLATVATTGAYSDLSGTPSIPTATSDLTNDSGFITASDIPAQQQSDWTQSDNTQVDYIKNKPALASVATSGSYNDLSDKPSIPAAQVNSDWNASSGVAEILNKPQLSTVATTGDYGDLLNKPSIPAAQVNSDWNASSGVAQILNKPSLAAVATSGSYSDLSNTPTIPTATSDLNNDSGFITLSDVPAQVNADWNSSSGASEILNKPTIPSGAQLVPAATSADEDKVLTVDAQGVPEWAVVPSQATGLFEAVYGTTTLADVLQAISDKKIVYCATQPVPMFPTRMAHLVDYTSINAVFQHLLSYSSGGGLLAVYEVTSSGWTAGTRSFQAQSDWAQSDSTAADFIKNKPANLVQDASYVHTDNNFTTAEKDKLAGVQAGAEVNVQSDWTQSNSAADDYIKNKPNLAAVATSGDYADLSNKPTIPAAQVNSDWSANSGVAQILNKPNLAAVATSGDYSDLSNTPTIPAAQVQSNWTESDTSSKAYIQNKPSLAAVATSGSYNDLNNTPTIPVVPAMKDLVAGANVTITEGSTTVTIAATGAAYTAGDGIDITNGVISWLNTAGITDIQSVNALPANPDPHTLYLTPDSGAQETVLYSGMKSIGDDGAATYTLSESPLNFQYIKVYWCAEDNITGGDWSGEDAGNNGIGTAEWDTQIYLNDATFIPAMMNGGSGTSFTIYNASANISGIRTTTWSVQGSLNSGVTNAKWFHIYKIVGINRITG